jgi:lichenan operon transcriptional antiterminator
LNGGICFSTYNLDLGESETNCSFLLHIDNLLVRLDNNIHLNNPMAESIKHYSPFTYDMAVFVANIISNKVEKPVSESEIAYIALHIGTYIEEIKSTRNRLRTIIVCPEYYVYSSPLKKINSIYKDDLYIYDIVTSFDDLDDLDNVELVISSTESINTLPPAKLVYISSFLNDGDRKRITAKISEIRQSKRFLRSRGAIASLFDESLYFPTTNLKSKNEILDFLCNELENKGYTEPSFKQAIYNRENISPTNFGMIAVPHPVEYNASRTVIGVAKPRKPIEWSEKKSKVSIVFIIAINKMDVQLFEDVFSSIIETASNPEKLKELISCETYYEFINTLANHFCS